MTAKRLSLTALALAVAIMVGCGSSDDGDQASSGKQGGAIAIAHGAQPDALDPALSYSGNSWEALWLAYTPPLTYRRAEGAEGGELIPGVAEALPEISENGKTYSFKIRDGLEYSDGTAVKASDFEHAIKRVLNLESGGTYLFEGIEGATEYIEAGKADGDISGIETDDDTGEVTVRLREPDGSFVNVLAMVFAAPVPSTTPFENQTKNPPPGVGPYAIAESVPNRHFTMEKVEGFDIEGIPQGKLDEITVKIVPSRSRQAQDVIAGRLDYMQDAPLPDQLAEIKARYSDRYREQPSLSSAYFFLNQAMPPFSDERVRKAVNVALDSSALARIYGGRLTPICSLVPETIPGSAAYDDEECPYGDPNGPGDVEQAKRLVEQAGATGEKVTVLVNSDGVRPQVGEYYTGLLNDIGLDADLRVIDGAVYFDTIGKRSTKAQTGVANWYADFPHPGSFLQQIDGTTIQDTNNGNYGEVDDPVISKGIATLMPETDLDAVADRWADLDRRALEKSHVAPFGSEELTTFMSERMNVEDCLTFHPIYGNDYSSFCLK